jgi:hypothetical protein
MADDLIKPDTLYERDFVAWTEEQARALRSRGGGGNALDHDHLAEEIEDLGKSELRACASQIDNIIEHLLKIEFSGQEGPSGHWRKELREFRRQLSRTVTPTLRNRLEPQLADMFDDVLKGLAEDVALLNADEARAARPAGYDWAEIASDFLPAPRPRA